MANEKRLLDAKYLEKRMCEVCNELRSDEPCEPADCSCRELIRKLIPVDAVEVVHGRWREKILVGGFAEEWGFVCSECGCTVSDRSNLGIGRYASDNQRLNYCPNCGAKMDGDGNG